jgi:hypothetical protein
MPLHVMELDRIRVQEARAVFGEASDLSRELAARLLEGLLSRGDISGLPLLSKYLGDQVFIRATSAWHALQGALSRDQPLPMDQLDIRRELIAFIESYDVARETIVLILNVLGWPTERVALYQAWCTAEQNLEGELTLAYSRRPVDCFGDRGLAIITGLKG